MRGHSQPLSERDQPDAVALVDGPRNGQVPVVHDRAHIPGDVLGQLDLVQLLRAATSCHPVEFLHGARSWPVHKCASERCSAAAAAAPTWSLCHIGTLW